MNVHLSDEVGAWATDRATQSGYPSLAGYIEALIRRDREDTNWFEDLIDTGSPTGDEDERQRTHETIQRRIVALLDEAVASGPSVEMTPADWDDIRRQVQARREQRNRP